MPTVWAVMFISVLRCLSCFLFYWKLQNYFVFALVLSTHTVQVSRFRYSYDNFRNKDIKRDLRITRFWYLPTIPTPAQYPHPLPSQLLRFPAHPTVFPFEYQLAKKRETVRQLGLVTQDHSALINRHIITNTISSNLIGTFNNLFFFNLTAKSYIGECPITKHCYWTIVIGQLNTLITR